MNRKEVIRKLLDGAKFKYKEYIIRYNPDESSYTPFIIEGHGTLKLWDHVEDWVGIKEWYEEIPKKGLLCMVWDCDSENITLRCITSYSSFYFFDGIGAAWDNAKPITLDEAKEYIL